MDSAVSAPVLVLGGAGFIGRHVCRALLAAGLHPIIGSRFGPHQDRRLDQDLARLPRRSIRFDAHLHAAAWRPWLDQVGLVINVAGILRQRGSETYRKVHTEAPGALAEACAAASLPLIHLSGLGLRHDAQSRFNLSKLAGESAIQASGVRGYIVRAPLLDGPDGYGARWLRRVANWPIQFIPARTAALAPMAVGDLAQILATMARELLHAAPGCRIVELSGARSMSLAHYLDALRDPARKAPLVRLQVPAALARLAAHVFDLAHLTPYSFGHHELLQHPNLSAADESQRWLGRPARTLHPSPGEGEPGAATASVPVRW